MESFTRASSLHKKGAVYVLKDEAQKGAWTCL